MATLMSNTWLNLMDELLDQNFRPMTYSLTKGGVVTTPALNVKEFDDRFEIDLVCPGVDPTKINIELKENMLNISYEDETHKKTAEESSENLIRQEYSEYVNFKRSLSMPKNIDSENIHAAYKKGILKITVNKTPESKPKSININVQD